MLAGKNDFQIEVRNSLSKAFGNKFVILDITWHEVPGTSMRYQVPGARDQLPDTMRPHVSWGSSFYTPSVVMMHHDRSSTKREGHLTLAHRQIFVDDPPCSLALFDSLTQGPSVKSVLRLFVLIPEPTANQHSHGNSQLKFPSDLMKTTVFIMYLEQTTSRRKH